MIRIIIFLIKMPHYTYFLTFLHRKFLLAHCYAWLIFIFDFFAASNIGIKNMNSVHY